jgi:hypothetical protein
MKNYIKEKKTNKKNEKDKYFIINIIFIYKTIDQFHQKLNLEFL